MLEHTPSELLVVLPLRNMARSMRLQTSIRKRTSGVIDKRREGQLKALKLLRTTSWPLRNISAATSVPKSTVVELKELIRNRNEKRIATLLSNPEELGGLHY